MPAERSYVNLFSRAQFVRSVAVCAGTARGELVQWRESRFRTCQDRQGLFAFGAAVSDDITIFRTARAMVSSRTGRPDRGRNLGHEV